LFEISPRRLPRAGRGEPYMTTDGTGRAFYAWARFMSARRDAPECRTADRCSGPTARFSRRAASGAPKRRNPRTQQRSGGRQGSATSALSRTPGQAGRITPHVRRSIDALLRRGAPRDGRELLRRRASPLPLQRLTTTAPSPTALAHSARYGAGASRAQRVTTR